MLNLNLVRRFRILNHLPEGDHEISIVLDSISIFFHESVDLVRCSRTDTIRKISGTIHLETTAKRE